MARIGDRPRRRGEPTPTYQIQRRNRGHVGGFKHYAWATTPHREGSIKALESVNPSPGEYLVVVFKRGSTAEETFQGWFLKVEPGKQRPPVQVRLT